MKAYFLMGIFKSIAILAFTQEIPKYVNKPPIDSSAVVKWLSFGSKVAISNDGRYFLYTVKNRPFGSMTLVVQSTNNSLIQEFIGANDGFFSGDNKFAIVKSADTLIFVSLDSNYSYKVSKVSSFKRPSYGKGEWLAYNLANANKELVLKNIYKGKELRFSNVTDYLFDNNGNVLLLKTDTGHDEKHGISLHWISLNEEKLKTIWARQDILSTDINLSNYTFDPEGTQLGFIVKERKNERVVNTVWYYKSGANNATVCIDNNTRGIDSGLQINDNNLYFSKSGKWLYFELKQNIKYDKADGPKVDVWSYKDTTLQSEQLQNLQPKTFTSVFDLKQNDVIHLEQNDFSILAASTNGDFLVLNDKNSIDISGLNSYSQRSYYFFSLRERTLKLINKGGIVEKISFSPCGKYLVYYERRQRNYFSFEIETSKIRNITKSISNLIDNEYFRSTSMPGYNTAVGIGGWLENDEAILIYDNYDIWKVDPLCKRGPLNITNAYGRLHNLKFRLVYENDSHAGIRKNETLLITAFNPINKYNGFFKKSLDQKGDPELLTMGPYITLIHKFTQTPNVTSDGITIRPLKARDTDIWILRRMTSADAPNYFLTKDFKSYTRLTNLQPQKDYNWLTSKLISWKQLDGTETQGVLYIPENFNPHKKYPIIFNYYEQLSFDLYAFLQPGFVKDEINIPWFVSQGYLVFRPDFHFSIASISNKTNGENAYNAVVSAARYLSKIPWVDAKRMGLNGHSFGGGITNYLISHTKIFAAAAEAAGPSNSVSSYLSLSGSLENPTGSRQSGTETGQGRIGATLWQRPDLFFRNSSIFKADQVTTPLLIMHNKADPAVPWAQGVEMYLALRRLGKKVWMLQYDEGFHRIDGVNSIDYTIRLNQFFDHYLKDAPVPLWMSNGVPARFKAIERGYGYDKVGICGKDCKICGNRKENQQKFVKRP